jgi:hypothetical protein
MFLLFHNLGLTLDDDRFLDDDRLGRAGSQRSTSSCQRQAAQEFPPRDFFCLVDHSIPSSCITSTTLQMSTRVD